MGIEKQIPDPYGKRHGGSGNGKPAIATQQWVEMVTSGIGSCYELTASVIGIIRIRAELAFVDAVFLHLFIQRFARQPQ